VGGAVSEFNQCNDVVCSVIMQVVCGVFKKIDVNALLT
jgi:hypothetical protein